MEKDTEQVVAALPSDKTAIIYDDDRIIIELETLKQLINAVTYDTLTSEKINTPETS